MLYLFISQSIVMIMLLFVLYQLKRKKKRLATNEKNSRNFAATVLEHEEKIRLKLTNSLIKIIKENENFRRIDSGNNENKRSGVIAELFTVADELTPFNATDDTLISAIEKLVKTHKRRNLKIAFTTKVGTVTIPTATEIIIYRIIKEGINNAKKHSLANKIFISLYFSDSAAEVTIEDNGIGFDTDRQTSGLGLRSISKAVNFLNGHVEIQSQKNRGTLLCALIPFNY